MQIGATNARRLYLYDDLGDRRSRVGKLAHLDLPVSMENNSAHVYLQNEGLFECSLPLYRLTDNRLTLAEGESSTHRKSETIMSRAMIEN